MVLNNLSVIDFYNGKSVFITGGTGFIGKVIIEKLLRTCRDIDKIYLLLREHKSFSTEQRIQDLVDKPIFDDLKKSDPDSLKKIVPVCGDISLSNLGIRSDDERSFIDKVSVVIHSAASVNFNEPLDVAVNLNYEGTKRVLNLCHRMKNLESLVYISTAFTYPDEKEMKEMVYPPPTTEDELQQFIRDKGMFDQDKLKQFLDNRPNSYTFTKALAECYVAKHHGNIPTAIVRPSITTASYKEPTPGYTDSWNGASPLVASVSLGYKRVVFGKMNHVLDIIPLDFVANAIIVAGAKCHSTQKLEIFNVCTSGLNPLTIKNLNFHNLKFVYKNKLNDVPLPFVILTNSEKVHNVLSLIFEKLPAVLADSWLKMRGKKPSTQKLEIFNVCTSGLNPLTIKNLNFHNLKFVYKNKLNDVPLPFVILTNSEKVHNVLSLIFEKLPAVLADSWLKMRGKKPRLVKIQQKIKEQERLVKYFTMKTWRMNADNTAALSRCLNPKESKIFYCNPQDISWKIYIPNYCRGVFKFLLKK